MKSIEEVARENQERWDALSEKHRREHEEFMDKFNAKMEKLDRDLEHSRSLSRNLIEKIIVLATSIVGFSVTILSVGQLNINLRMSELMVSWILFASTIAFGLLIPEVRNFLERIAATRVRRKRQVHNLTLAEEQSFLRNDVQHLSQPSQLDILQTRKG
jgi:hypothetical protein